MSELEPRDVGPRVGGDLPITVADRSLVAAVLDAALREGRLGSAEYTHRSQLANQALTFDDLIPLTRDLQTSAVPHSASARLISGATALASGSPGSRSSLVALFSGFDRQGAWTAPAQITSLTVFGGGKLDLSQAVWSSPVIEVTVTAVFGGVDIWVPPGTEVVNHVIAVLGSATAQGMTGPPNGRRLVVRGLSVFSGVNIKTK